MKISNNIFWDVDYESVDFEHNAQFVIERVLNFGTLQDLKQIIEFYGKDKIKDIIKNSRVLDKKTRNFCEIYFAIPKKHTWTKPFWLQQLWPY